MKNLDLKEMDLVELDSNEIQLTDGGIAPLVVYGLYLAVGAIFGAGVYVGYKSAAAAH